MTNGQPNWNVSQDLLGGASLNTYVEIARRRKWWIIFSTLGIFICANIIAKRMPDLFRAETVVLVDSGQVPANLVATVNTGDLAGRVATLEQQVLSPTRLKKLVEAEGLFPDPAGKRTEEQIIRSVQKSITVEVVNPGAGKLSAFHIAYTSRQRNEVAKIANHLAQMFCDENLAARVNQAEDTAQFLDDQLQDTKRELDQKDAQLNAIKSRNVLELPESKAYHMETLANLRAQVQVIQDKIQGDQREKGVLQSMLLGGGESPTVEVGAAPGGGAGGTGSIYDTQISKLETKLSELKTHYGPAHPDVRRTQNEIDKLKAKAAADAKDKPNVEAGPQQAEVAPQPTRHNPVLEAQIEKLDEEIQAQTKLLQPLQDQMAFHESKLQQIPAFEQQIARLQQDYDALRTQYVRLLDNKKAAEISHALEVHQKGEKFEVLDFAITPNGPSAPNRSLIQIAGLIGGLLAGIALAAIAETNDASVRSESEAAQILGKPVLSGIPKIVSAEERRNHSLRIAGALAGTLAGSVAIGFIISFLSGAIL